MKTFVANANVNLPVAFAANGEPFIPTGNVTYELRGQAGTVVANGNVAVGNVTSYIFPLDSSLNTISGSSRFEKRTLVVSVGTWTQNVPYRLAPWLNTSATPADVRGALGLDEEEFPDNLIDLTVAYYAAETRIGQTAFEAALAAGDETETAANRAIVLYAALASLTALQLRVMAGETDGPQEYKRFKVDFVALEADLREQLQEVLGDLTADDTVLPTLAVFTTPTDPVTGV